MNTVRLIGIFILLFTIVFGVSFLFGLYVVDYVYESKIGSHIENAYEVNTPERIIIELQLAKQGMVDADLTPEDYGAIWFKKPDNSMKFQYEFIDSIIERAEAVQEWHDKVSNSTAAVENLGDVYEQKIDNIREFIMENGRSDWIAKDTWYIKNHVLYYLLFVWVVIGIVILFIIGSVCICHDSKRCEDEEW